MEQMALGEERANLSAPLAERMRPLTLDEVVGQPSLCGPDAMLRKAVQQSKPYSMILWGPPGCGKTTLAQAAARSFGMAYSQLNAVTDGLPRLREIIKEAEARRGIGERTLLFIDEIARWSSSQQDALLPYVENGTLILVGATTEHPGHRLQPALRSRLKVEKLDVLDRPSLEELLERALKDERGLKNKYSITEPARDELYHYSGGDARALLTGLESATLLVGPGGGEIDQPTLSSALGERSQPGGKTASADLVSALIKSIRGSDINASLYWMARLEAAGEDPLYVARRLVVSASEEVGLAQPGALAVAVAAYQSTQILGAPECWIPLAATTSYLAGCPKSWRAYQGLGEARRLVEEHDAYPVPLHLRNASNEVDREQGYGKNYKHPAQSSADQDYLPQQLKDQQILPD